MLVVENTPKMRNIQKVAATMAIEGMPVSKELIREAIKIDKGEKTSEELIQELTKKYAR